MQKKSRFGLLLFLIITLLIFDILGYMIIERVSLLDALYMTIISITTVGFKEVFPLSTGGKIFTIFVIITGIGFFFYIGVSIAEKSIEERFRKIFGRRKMKTLAKMRDHIIIAGFGRMGKIVASELDNEKLNFVIVENNPERFARAEELGYHVLLADATSEETLELAGIKKSRIYIALLSSDAENLFTVLTARELNPSILIIARCFELQNEKKLSKSGANRVVSPHQLSSRRIVNTVLKPNVVNLIDLVSQSQDLSLSLEEITIGEDSEFIGKSIRDSGIKKRYNAMVVAVKRKDNLFFVPSADLVLVPDDILILIGDKSKITKIS
ncbi:MAG: potassium channel protein [Candidatus Aminicenantes bacterium]|nr:potassium channel protein [Candidatus Aminicenantes bacterium]